MTEQEYAKGLEKLGLLEPPNHRCTYACIGAADWPEGHQSSPPDLRKNPAFAWRVLEAYHKLPDGSVPQVWIRAHKTLADALYAAVVALGREDA